MDCSSANRSPQRQWWYTSEALRTLFVVLHKRERLIGQFLSYGDAAHNCHDTTDMILRTHTLVPLKNFLRYNLSCMRAVAKLIDPQSASFRSCKFCACNTEDWMDAECAHRRTQSLACVHWSGLSSLPTERLRFALHAHTRTCARCRWILESWCKTPNSAVMYWITCILRASASYYFQRCSMTAHLTHDCWNHKISEWSHAHSAASLSIARPKTSCLHSTSTMLFQYKVYNFLLISFFGLKFLKIM